MRFRVCPGFKGHHLIIHSSSLYKPIYPTIHTHINTCTHTHTHPHKCRRQVAVLRLMPGFLPPRVSGDGDAGGAVVLQWLQGREEAPLQTNCLGQTGQLQVGWDTHRRAKLERNMYICNFMVGLNLKDKSGCTEATSWSEKKQWETCRVKLVQRFFYFFELLFWCPGMSRNI